MFLQVCLHRGGISSEGILSYGIIGGIMSGVILSTGDFVLDSSPISVL